MARNGYVNGGGLLGISWKNILIFCGLFFFFTKLRDAILNVVGLGPDPKSQEEEAVTKRKQDKISNVVVDQTELDRPLMYYSNLADILYVGMHGAGTDKSKIELLRELSVQEFKQVFKAFNVRQNEIFGMNVMSGNLVEWLEYELNDLGDKQLLTELRRQFSASGLW